MKSKHKSRGSISHPKVSVVIEHPTPTRTVASNSTPGPSTTVGKKRPRRSVAVDRSYVIPDSEDESDTMAMALPEEKVEEKKRIDHLQLWVENLGDLQKIEQAKVSFNLPSLRDM